ncbi:hypothetical protein ACFOWX_04970 [Sphingorhabdus arenilitoris]|uniref:Energy transducer TonB n=1 Tax=Sphingorhabdus arenilitoris TaxID=1490041 RepID=A0ABV8RHP0_9SPHN
MKLVQSKAIAIQRIQVGIIGLVVVLLFVTLANMVQDRATATEAADGDGADPALLEVAAQEKKIPDEPLAELGAAPVVESDADAKEKAAAKVKNKAPEQKNVEITQPQ